VLALDNTITIMTSSEDVGVVVRLLVIGTQKVAIQKVAYEKSPVLNFCNPILLENNKQTQQFKHEDEQWNQQEQKKQQCAATDEDKKQVGNCRKEDDSSLCKIAKNVLHGRRNNSYNYGILEFRYDNDDDNKVNIIETKAQTTASSTMNTSRTKLSVPIKYISCVAQFRMYYVDDDKMVWINNNENVVVIITIIMTATKTKAKRRKYGNDTYQV
jgi:hypothetical protein